MRCDDVDILGTLDGTASDADRAHVDGCETCRGERAALERQLDVLLAWYREKSPCPATDEMVDRALADGVAELAPHLDECAECSSEWERLKEMVDATEDADAPAEPLRPEWLDAIRARSGAAPMDLPLAAQPEDLTDTTDEYEKRRKTDDEPGDDDTEG